MVKIDKFLSSRNAVTNDKTTLSLPTPPPMTFACTADFVQQEEGPQMKGGCSAQFV
jgi:hypothetical protein